MGINNGYEVCKSMLSNAILPNNPINSKLECNVYIDGYVLWRSGQTNANPQKIDVQIVNSNLQAIFENIERSNYFIINSKSIYFDGKPSPLKKTKNSGIIYANSALRAWIQDIRGSDSGIDVVELDKGEAEYECFLRRNRDFASIICSSDSDLLHISYNSPSRTAGENPKDRVFFYRLCYNIRGSENIMYDANLFSTKLNKNSFTLLLYLLGDENYIESLFTQSMVEQLFILLKIGNYSSVFDKINKIMNELSTDSVEKCIAYFIWLLCHAKKNLVVGEDKIRVIWSTAMMESKKYIEVLCWMIMYSQDGEKVKGYSSFEKTSEKSEKITKLNYIYDICNKVFPPAPNSGSPIENTRHNYKALIEQRMNEIDQEFFN